MRFLGSPGQAAPPGSSPCFLLPLTGAVARGGSPGGFGVMPGLASSERRSWSTPGAHNVYLHPAGPGDGELVALAQQHQLNPKMELQAQSIPQAAVSVQFWGNTSPLP